MSAKQMEQNCAQLIATKPCDPSTISELASCLESQIESGWFSVDVNLGLMKAIQFNSSKLDPDTIETLIYKLFLKAMQEFPKPYFSWMVQMLPKSLYEKSYVSRLSHMAGLLEGADYPGFWAAYSHDQNAIDMHVPNFSADIKKMIISQVSNLFANIKRSDISMCLNGDLDGLAESKSNEDPVIFEHTENNASKPKETETITHLKLSHLQPLL